ncbi:hypothetical protein NHX12_029729 [Muraenolepis orangiensis]|uniref:Uncharacterized protein n=1 Tax=Muraenolepis orangiensis TaxID=630683 RepID=A0A9Q0EAE9_9TELE|nr:hypothetical protein NHX12_029729 [Muraenolepis orangiensis]
METLRPFPAWQAPSCTEQSGIWFLLVPAPLRSWACAPFAGGYDGDHLWREETQTWVSPSRRAPSFFFLSPREAHPAVPGGVDERGDGLCFGGGLCLPV